MSNRGHLSWSSLPVEIGQYCLSLCHPLDVLRFAVTSSTSHSLVHDTDEYLWRELFIKYPFDPSNITLDWKYELLRRVKAELVATRGSEVIDDQRDAIETFISVMKTSSPLRQLGTTVDTLESYNITWLQSVLENSTDFFKSVVYAEGAIDSLSAKLRAHLCSLILGNMITENGRARRRMESRAYVYNLKNYSRSNSWGPYRRDGLGGVNWNHIEHIINVVLLNIRDLPAVWLQNDQNKGPPLQLQATRAYSAPESSPSADWAGVTGTWRRYVCFLDYRDFHNYNFHYSGGMHFFSENHDVREATRAIDLQLELLENAQNSQSFGESDVTYPDLYFQGTSRGLVGHEAQVRGNVKLGADGIARWQFSSSYDDGNTEWFSQGVQIANIASGIGIAGIWSTADHEESDPVGPFWLWKVETLSGPNIMEHN